MGVILNNSNSYKSFEAILDFSSSDTPVNVFVLKNEIGVLSITSAGTGGQFYVNLSDVWPEQDTFIPGIVCLDAPSGTYTHVANIVWDNAFSTTYQLLFSILDKNANFISAISASKVAFEIRIYNSHTSL